MNDAHGITPESLLAAFPPALAADENMYALAKAISTVLAERIAEIKTINLYAHIDSLPEELLDILAEDFKVDWWDGNYTLEEKRETLKGNWLVHRRLGTPYAVISAISAIYPDTKLSEWWEYNGKPYHFKLLIDATYEHVDAQKHARVLEKVNFYKNLRSSLDKVEYYDAGCAATAYGFAAAVGNEIVDGATAFSY